MRTSMWLSQHRPTFPVLTGDLDVDVAVVGGGWVGLHAAFLAQRGGVRVAVFEAADVGSGTTGFSTAKLTTQHGLIYADLVDRHGAEAAAQYAEANTAGVELVVRLVGELGIDCDLTTASAYAYTLDPARRLDLEREVEAAQHLGLPATLEDSAGLPFDVEAAVCFAGQYHLDPVRYLDGLARALVGAGGAIYEHTRITGIEELRDQTVTLTTEHGSEHGTGHGTDHETGQGTVRANQVIVATLLPIGTLGGYFAKTRPVGAYGAAVRLRGPAPAPMTIQVDPSSWSTRPWPAAGPGGLLVIGNGHEVGSNPSGAAGGTNGGADSGDRQAQLDEWARSRFEVESVEHRWFAHDYATPDQIPYVGLSSAHRSVMVATGFRKWGLSNGAAAAIMLSDLLAGRDHGWAEPFDATRIGDAHAVSKLITDNMKVGKEFLTGRIGNDNPTCTHLGCPLHWNNADSSWDCNCHGSRFTADGAVLTGPAVKPLETPGQPYAKQAGGD